MAAELTAEKQTAFDWVAAHDVWLSGVTKQIWDLHEPAWREYRSAAYYVGLLRDQGFEVEQGTGGMPTAFRATFGSGRPVIASYAEYDAVPGNSQEAVPYRKPREGVHEQAAGHTDPHSALGTGALGGVLAAKAALERHRLPGTLVLFGEPAEKVCGSKPVHAAYGYYDGLDAAISFHPAYIPAHSNTVRWDTHCGSYWSAIYTFECHEPESWAAMGASEETANPHTSARAPGAIDAVCLMYTASKYLKEAMLPHTGTWTINEAILAAGQATADNEPPRFGQIQFSSRAPTLEMQERIFSVLDQNAEHAAAIAHCTVRKGWVTKTRTGLPNHVLAELTYENLELAGPPVWGEEARAFGREIQAGLGLEPMDDPILPAVTELTTPAEGEALLRAELPPWQQSYTSDDALHRARVPAGAVRRLPVPRLELERARRLSGHDRPDGRVRRADDRRDDRRPAHPAGPRRPRHGRVQRPDGRRDRRRALGGAAASARLRPADQLPLARVRDDGARDGVVDPAGCVKL
jgi:aminobenzoyl-glutamate utilization protein B